jgi:hypothetical protein
MLALVERSTQLQRVPLLPPRRLPVDNPTNLAEFPITLPQSL